MAWTSGTLLFLCGIQDPEVLFAVVVHGLALPGPGGGYVFLTGVCVGGSLRYLFQEHGGRQGLMTTDESVALW